VNGFTAEVDAVHKTLFSDRLSAEDAAGVLGGWLQRYQPCLFGRIAAKYGQLSYCVLLEHELNQEDHYLRDRIQEARSQWTAAGFNGTKSGFMIVVVSPRIALATPNRAMKELAQRLCSLYLLEEVELDRVYLDEVFLEMPGGRRTSWAWYAGVNYFCAQGDKRWWHDHRIPGGMAFSVNSVGHMVKSGVLAKGLTDLAELMGAPAEARDLQKLESLEDALALAMRTISLAADAVSGKATWLVPAQTPADELPACPIALPASLSTKSHCSYQGYYHTDHTLPSSYFVPDVERPASVLIHDLDLTYLFDDRLDNPDHETMGRGRKIRGLAPATASDVMETLNGDAIQKRRLALGRQVSVIGHPRLAAALELRGS
jgi:hypothetical protein